MILESAWGGAKVNISMHVSVLTEGQENLLAYWVSICRGGRIPSRRELNPALLGAALANTSLVERANNSFRFRLTGSRIEAVFGRGGEGRVIDEIDASIAEAGTESMELALETGRPVSGSRKLGARWHCWLRVPLLDDAGNRRLVLCLDEFPSREPGAFQEQARDGAMIERIVA